MKDTKSLKKDYSLPQSQLASKLLALWAHGLLSASLLQEIAYLAMQDGAQHPELQALASTGNYGQCKGNIHRDVMAKFCQDIEVAEPSYVPVPCLDPKTNKVSQEDAAMFLPHLTFWKLGVATPEFFHHLFSLEKSCLENFWKKVEDLQDPKLSDHPLKKGFSSFEKSSWREKTIPIIIHGDGVEYHNRDSLMVWSWAPLLNQLPSLESHSLLCVWPKSCQVPETFQPIWTWLKWSFEALAKGYHPTVDPWGEPLKKGVMQDMQGQPLHTKHYRCFVWSILGDQEFFSNTLDLPHWASHYPCHQCDCQNFDGADDGKHVKEIRMNHQKFILVSHKEALKKAQDALEKAHAFTDKESLKKGKKGLGEKEAHGGKTEKPLKKGIHPILTLPGVSSQMVKGDCLHILFSHGVLSHFLGSVLHTMVYYEGPGKKCAVPAADRLGKIFTRVQTHYSEQGCKSRMTNLKLSMITDPKKPNATWASLDSKGAECKHLAFALLPVVKEAFEKSAKPHEKQIVEALEAITELINLWDNAANTLTSDEFDYSILLGERFFNLYHDLNQWAADEGRSAFHVVHKFHTLLHTIQQAKYLNPKVNTCWRGEDFVGHLSKLAHSVSFGVKSTRITQKLAPKYRVLMHLLLSRKDFIQHTENVFDT